MEDSRRALELASCELCFRRCRVDRRKERGYCGAGIMPRVALASLHTGEEPCLAGERGAGTVFFSHCSLRCCFCQNHPISREGRGRDVTVEELAEMFLELQGQGAEVLDLVTPTHYAPQVRDAIFLARQRGLSLPVAYNTSACERAETIAALAGAVDIFLPDLKYMDEENARCYSDAPGYFPAASAAIRKMVEVAGPVQMDGNGRMRRGVLVRHLVLPGCRKESMAILDWLWQTFGDDIWISLMRQYTPMYRSSEHREIHRRLTTFEYESVVDHAIELGITQCYTQGADAASTAFVPAFE